MVSKELKILLQRIQRTPLPKFNVGDEAQMMGHVRPRALRFKITGCHKAAIVDGSPWWYNLSGLTVPVHEGMLKRISVEE